MNIFRREQIQLCDQLTIDQEPIASIDLMERAATNLHHKILELITKKDTIQIVCGIGNNGGDGLVLARLLAENGYKCNVSIIKFSDKCTADFSSNLKRLKEAGVAFTEVTDANQFEIVDNTNYVIDSIFGAGLTRPVEGFVKNVIDKINTCSATVISVDVPSGIGCDGELPIDSFKVKADFTYTFEVPKLAHVNPELDAWIGQWRVVPIGLKQELITNVKDIFVTSDIVRSLHKKRGLDAHKWSAGHAYMAGGSYGKLGAITLASRACLRVGAGLVTAHIPRCGYDILQQSSPEIMVVADEEQNEISGYVDVENYNAVGVGPGLGTGHMASSYLKLLIQNTGGSIVIDADALNILARNPTWLAFLPQNSILTPHHREFERLFGGYDSILEAREIQRQKSIKLGVYIVLKGPYTTISTPSGLLYYNSTGNPGMATAGAGDVLTGIITGLIAQGYNSLDSAIIGCYIHGLAGDLYVSKYTQETLIATDLLKNLGKAIRYITFAD